MKTLFLVDILYLKIFEIYTFLKFYQIILTCIKYISVRALIIY